MPFELSWPHVQCSCLILQHFFIGILAMERNTSLMVLDNGLICFLAMLMQQLRVALPVSACSCCWLIKNYNHSCYLWYFNLKTPSTSRSMNVDKEGLYVQEDMVISNKDDNKWAVFTVILMQVWPPVLCGIQNNLWLWHQIHAERMPLLSLSQLFKFDQLFKFLDYSLNSQDHVALPQVVIFF